MFDFRAAGSGVRKRLKRVRLPAYLDRDGRATALIQRHARWLVAAAVAVAVAGTVATGALAWYSWSIFASLPDDAAIRRAGDMAEATTILDASDRPVFTIYKEQRIEIPLERMSPHLVRAIIAVEDQRFYDHAGIDYVRVIGAALNDLRLGRRAQGGSTITQQLARQSFLTAEKTIRRKLSEAILAARLERFYAKAEILRLYLNKVYFGEGFYGVEAASRGYFGKPASALSLPEAALIAGLVKSPSAYSPAANLERAVSRRNLVLQVMRDAGAITTEEWESARNAPVVLRNMLEVAEPYGLYFKEQVRRELVERFGWERVYQGGLRVYTNIDMEMQRAAEEAVAATLADIEKRREAASRKARARAAKDDRAAAAPEEAQEALQAALVAIDPATGAVRAMVGGRNFAESSFNRAVQARRQPGSAFKPFIFAEALENGYTPATIIERLDEPIPTIEGRWAPEDGHSSAPSMSLRAALRTSSNRAAVRLLQDVGIVKAVNYAERAGIGAVPGVPSLALGSGEVTLLSLTAAYVPFAEEGIARTPFLVRRVEGPDGEVLFAATQRTSTVISPSTAFLMSQMLADVVDAGTGYRARSAGFRLPAAGKTGTTNDYYDAWFVGYTPNLVAGVWIGFDQPKTILRDGFAGDLAVPLWAEFMKDATRGDKPATFKQPRDVTAVAICKLSGKLPAPGCDHVKVVDGGEVEERSMIYTEYFRRGTAPRDVCPLHPASSLLDRIAGVFTGSDEPAATVESTTARSSTPPAVAPRPESAGDSDEAASEQVEAPKKKRGFFARLFGIGRDRDDDDQKERDKKEQERRREEQDKKKDRKR